MNDGGALLVPKNSLHGADEGVPGVEAYAWSPAMCAAGTEGRFDPVATISQCWNSCSDSIFRKQSKSAVLSAWQLRWDCICEDFQDFFHRVICNDARSLTPWQAPSNAFRQHENGSHLDVCSRQYDVVSNVVAPVDDMPDVLHVRNSNELSDLVLPDMQQFQRSSSPVTSCIHKSNAIKRSKSVQFDARVLLHIGLEEEIAMATVQIAHDDLQGWSDKPWTRKPKKTKVREPTRSHTLHSNCPRTMKLACSNNHVLYHTNDLARLYKAHGHEPSTKVAFRHHDDHSLMQIDRPFGVVLKNEPNEYQQIHVAGAIQGGHATHGDSDTSLQEDGLHESDGYTPSDAIESPVIRTPSTDDDRQDVMLYHMQDPPIYARISWSNYEDMMSEIAHHFALERNALIDAYEVVSHPPDLEPDVTPIIVHAVHDFPLHIGGRLVLLDIEYHAHRVEAHFQSGPSVTRQVLRLARHVNRNELLACANVERYCRAEQGRCLVFINSRRWPDYDVDRKNIAHGDYVKISLPPSERFSCPTEVITDLTQRRLTDQQILDEIAGQEAVSDVSPEMLTDDEIRQLATPRLIDGDAANFMQIASGSNAMLSAGELLDRSESSDSIIPQDWMLNLERVVFSLENCGNGPNQEFLFSIYTWMVDHRSDDVCREPKVVVLGGDPTEWEEDIRQPWQHLLEHREHVFLDLAAPSARRANLEEHVAHVIITRHHSSKSSVLVSIEFVDVTAPSVIVRFAVVLPKECTPEVIISAIPLLTAFALNPIEWVVPEIHDNQHSFRTWSGMGIIVKVHPWQNDTLDAPEGEIHSLLQSAPFQEGLATLPEVGKFVVANNQSSWRRLHKCRDLPDFRTILFYEKNADSHGAATTFSLTEEFIRFVQAVGSQTGDVGTTIPMPDGLHEQPMWVQDLWEKWAETLAQNGGTLEEGLRIETWFINPRRSSRCSNSRLVVLSSQFQHWERELLAAWPDRADVTLPTQYAIVFPTPEDADRTAQEQLIIEQESEPFSRSVVSTRYDTNWDSGRPSSIALVVADRLDARSFITLNGYSEICSPEHEQNECLMWMGNIAIHPDQTVNVRLGNAFRLLIRRGIRVSVQELLSMSDRRLRNELQSAIGGCIFRRPNVQGFPSDANALNNPADSAGSTQQSNDEYPPDWLNSLQECFDRYAFVENTEQGRVIYVLVWFLNGGSFLRNESPQVVRLDADHRWWRTELLFPWRDRFARGFQIDVHFVDPIPVSEPWQSHAAHVIVSQALPQDHVPVLVTIINRQAQQEQRNQVALVVHQFSSAQNLMDRCDQFRSQRDHFEVTRGRNVFPEELTVRVGPGDGLTLRVWPSTSEISTTATASATASLPVHPIIDRDSGEVIDEHDNQDLDDALLMQAFQTVHAPRPFQSNSELVTNGTQCAIGLSENTNTEAAAFQFNPAAPEFHPSAHVLPAWAQVIEDIYHDWDVHAFAWQGEPRATHFMTWYLAPGINRLQCLYGRKIVLFADFWNWREQFRRQWQDEMDPGADIDVVYVSPPPTQLEAGIVGHIILLQHNAAEWSSILLSVSDPAINAGYVFKMAHAFPEQLQFQQILTRIGYANDCANLAQCHFHLRGHNFVAEDRIRASDGDAVDLTVQRVVWPVNWHPPVVPHMPGAEGLALIQKKVALLRNGRFDSETCHIQRDDSATVISLNELIGTSDNDISQVPFTLASLFHQIEAQEKDIVVAIWKLHKEVDVDMLPNRIFEAEQAKARFCSKHSLIKPCSDLYPVKFTRAHWGIGDKRWYVGSFVPPDSQSAVVACVEYTSSGATAAVNMLPTSCGSDMIRSMLNIRFGTFIRLNGKAVGAHVQLAHGDLLEYHVGQAQQLTIDRKCTRVQLCLDAVVDNVKPRFDEEADAIEVLPNPSIQTELQNEDSWAFHLIPEGTPLHKTTFEALHQTCESRGPAEKYELYIDGATSNGQSGWAVIAVRVSGADRCFMGCIAGLTEINHSSVRWIGAENHTNIDAELSAMTVATAFAYFAASEAPVTIRPDLALSQQFLNLQCTTRQHSTLVKVLHVLGQVRPTGIDVNEVRAHRGDPWNELADAVARHAAVTGCEVGYVPWQQLNQIALSPSTAKWEWLRHEPDSFCKTMPVLFGGAVWQPAPSSKQLNVQVYDTVARTGNVGFSFKIATYNGLALNDDADQPPTVQSRAARLDMQFHHEKIALVGIQEARTSEGCRVSENYRIFSSGYQLCGKTKHFGCELWIRKTLPFCSLPDGRKIGLMHCKITVVVRDARLLVVNFEGPIAITVVVAHAPCVTAERPLCQVSEWWAMLSQQICSCRHGHQIVLIDANAPLADCATQFFGLHQSERMNPQGFEFQEFLVSNELFVPATFESHSGPGVTWRHPRGDQLRRDYVLLGKSLFSVCTRSYVLSDFDGGFAHVDHCPAVCVLDGFIEVEDTGRRITWDFQKIHDVGAQKAFAEALETLPVPTWSVSIDDHSALLETQLLQLAQQHFGCRKKEKQRPGLQQATIAGIQLKRQMLDMMRRQDFVDPLLQQEIKTIEGILRPLVKRDQQEWYAVWLEGINEAGAKFDSAMVYKKLQRLGRRKKCLDKGPKPLPRLKVAENEFAQSFVECQETWKRQFALIEAGISVSEVQLAQLHLQSAQPCAREVESCPDPSVILSILRRCKNGKVPGPGQLPVDILKAGGPKIAKILTPLLVKAAWHMREPLTWKGGLLVPLFKGKGSPAEPSAYRSIFLSDICAKVHHSHMRRTLADLWNQKGELIQMGGKKGCSTDVAHHFLHAHLSWSRAKNLSCGLLFVDLQAAFYSVLRSSLFAGECHDDQICFAMKQLGITPQDWQDIKECVTCDHATMGLDDHHVGILRDMFSGTHFQMHGLTDKTVTTRGTRPGDPVADILFNMAFRLVVLDARRKIRAATGIPCFGSPVPADDITCGMTIPSKGFAEITFVDDIAYAIHSTSAEDLVSHMQVTASCLHDAAAARGLGINYQAGKTEAILKLSGKGAKSVKQKVWHECGGYLPVVTEKETQYLRIVHSYKHLGSYVQDHAIVQKDVRYRVSQAKKAYGQLSRPFYQKKNVNDQVKGSVFSALVMSRLTYNVHTWSWVTESDIECWQNGIKAQVAAVAKHQIRPIPPFQFSTAELCAFVGIHGPVDILHANRLRYARRAICTAPAALWGLLHDNPNCKAWMPQLVESYQWMKQHLRPGTVPECRDSTEILQFVALDQKLQGHVRSALASSLQYHKAKAQGKLWTARLQNQITKFADISVQQAFKADKCWRCNLCNETFDSKKALSVHARHKHKYRTVLKYYVLGDECLACGKKFFNRVRLLAHVGNAQACKDTYMACFVPAAEEDVEQIATEEREHAKVLKSQGWHVSKAFLPATRVQGPLLPECGTEDAAAMQAKWRHRVQVAGRAYEGLDGFCEQGQQSTDDEVEIIPFLFQTNGGQVRGEAGMYQQFGLAAETARLHIKGFLFVHFFSGYRRLGDLQACIESHDIVGRDHVFCLSVDLCLAKLHSDLTDDSTKKFWIEKMKSGQIIGVGGGPSCETWSAARYASNGPPPVRSFECPWGLPGLSRRQWQQVVSGTKLIQFLVDLLVLAAQLGLCGFVEHPQYPVWLLRKKPASIWTLTAMRVLARLECIQICSFDQCVYGLRATKPTTLMLLRLDTFKDITFSKGRRGRCSHPTGHLPLQGIQSDGTFATARAKVYPTDMNKAIALAVSRFLTERQLTTNWTKLPQDLQELNCTDFVDDSIVQPDFHRMHCP